MSAGTAGPNEEATLDWLVLGMFLLGAAAPLPPGATEVAYFDFPQSQDRRQNQPSGWHREFQPGYPYYIDAELTKEAAATGTQSLLFRLNGGHCAYLGPLLPASTENSFVLQGQIRTVGLVGDEAFLLLDFLDGSGRLLPGGQLQSEAVGGTQDWTIVRIGPVVPPPGTQQLRIGCISQHGPEMDLSGKVYFDDLWLGKLPRYEVTTSSDYRLFPLAGEKQARARVTGAEGGRYSARFALSDERRRPMAEATVRLRPDGPTARVAEWTLPIRSVGFFHLEVGLYEGSQPVLARDFPVTVVDLVEMPAQGEFGLSAPAPPFGLAHYDRLLAASGARWLKLPLWGAAEQAADLNPKNRALAAMIERMHARGHDLVGVLEQPPAALLQNLPPRSLGIADVFTLPESIWQGAIEGLMARRGLEVTRWQLGGDDDTSFESLVDPAAVVEQVEQQMRQIGRDARVGLPWSWDMPPSPARLAFLSLTDEGASSPSQLAPSPLTADKLVGYLEEQRRLVSLAQRPTSETTADVAPTPPALWVHLAPLSDRLFAREDRILDLARRVLAAKIAKADAIFATNILAPDGGLVAADGAPTELFTIWRTLARQLGGRAHLGSLYLPGAKENHVFVRDGTATLVLRGDGDSTIPVVTGPGAIPLDLWGRQVAAASPDVTGQFKVGSLPIFILEAREALIRFQMGARYGKGRVSGEYGTHADELWIENPFPVTLRGRVRPRFPRDWRVEPESIELDIPTGGKLAAPLRFDIPQGTGQGEYQAALDFDIAADQVYRFTLPRPYRLGGDEMDTTTRTRLLADGSLEVEARIQNLTPLTLTLECSLRARGRNVDQAVVSTLAAREATIRRFVIPAGRELLGTQLELDIDQVGGRRQITVRFPARAE